MHVRGIEKVSSKEEYVEQRDGSMFDSNLKPHYMTQAFTLSTLRKVTILCDTGWIKK